MFSGTVSEAGAVLPDTGTATATQGFNSNPFDLQASAFSSTTAAGVTQDFRWQAEPAGKTTLSPSGTLNLLFGSNGTSPAETGLSMPATDRSLRLRANFPAVAAVGLSPASLRARV